MTSSWIRTSLDALAPRRRERLLLVDLDDPEAVRACAQAIGDEGELAVLTTTAAATEELEGLDDLAAPSRLIHAVRPVGLDLGTFDAVLVATLEAPGLDLAATIAWLAGQLRPGGRLLLDLPGPRLPDALERAFTTIGLVDAARERLCGPELAALEGAVLAAGLRQIEVAELTELVPTDPVQLAAEIGTRWGLADEGVNGLRVAFVEALAGLEESALPVHRLRARAMR